MREGKGHRAPRAHHEINTVAPYKRRGKQIQLQRPGPEEQDADIELATRIQEALQDCSRQRLRSLQMTLRRYANLDARLQLKDLQVAFQESNVKLSSRTYQLIVQKFGDHNGIDYERVWKFLRKALYDTGRDSIRAILASNITDTAFVQKKTDEDQDKELVERVKEQFDESEFAPNLESFRSFLRENDTSRCGKVPQHTVLQVVGMARLPLYGSLLKSVLRRCDQEKNQQISWPELLNILERAWTELKKQYPDVAQKPLPKEPSKTTDIDLSGIKKRLLIKKQSLANGETIEQPDRDKSPSPKVAAKATPQTPDKTEPEEEKRPSSRGGFFKSVRGFLGAGKKKQSPERTTSIPVIQVEKETKTSDNATKTTNNDFIEVSINDKPLKIWCPDDAKTLQTSADPPRERLKLDWIHGYGGRREGSTILILASHEIAYHIGNTVVLQDFEKHHQRHYREHSEEIRALAVHSDGVTMASGQCASKYRSSHETAHIRIWRSDTLQTTKQIGSGIIHLSTTFLAFVPNKPQIISIDQSLDREITLWDCNTGKKITSSKLGTEMVCVLLFHPSEHDLLITGGKEHLSWWRITEKGAIQSHGKALYGSHLRPKYVTSAAHNEKGDLITGDSNGTIYIWNTKDHRLLNMVKHAHGGPITDLIVYRNSVMSSGKDFTVRNWLIEKYMDPIGTFQISEQQGFVRVLRKYRGYLLMGTTFNSILYFEMNKKGHPFDSPIEMKVLTQGTKSGVECILPVKMNDHEMFVSIGKDSALDLIDAQDREVVWHYAVEGLNISCADVNWDGSFMVVATKNGTIVGFKLVRGETTPDDEEQQAVPLIWYDLTKTVEETPINEWCVQPSVVKIAPDSSIIAIAGMDFNIYLARTEMQQDPETEEVKQVFVVDKSISGHKSIIVGLDFSNVAPWILRCYFEDKQTKFWKLEDLKEMQAKETRNQDWRTENCRTSFKMAGLWKTRSVLQSGIASHRVSHHKTLVVFGDKEGFISMSRFPASQEIPFVHTYKCSLNSVQLIAFSPEDRFVATHSSDDRAVMQWKVL